MPGATKDAYWSVLGAALYDLTCRCRRKKGLQVSTVHRAQGSERKIVIFDLLMEVVSSFQGRMAIGSQTSLSQEPKLRLLSSCQRMTRTTRRSVGSPYSREL